MDQSGEEDDQGLLLNPTNFMSSGSDRNQQNFTGDELYFTGYDLARARSLGNSSSDNMGYGEEYGYSDEEEQWEIERQRYAAYLLAVRERDEALVQSAQEKMREARVRGKSNVNLSQQEVDALERRRLQQQPEPLAPRTPSKGKSSRSSSAASLSTEKPKKKTNRLFSAPAPKTNKSRSSKSRSRDNSMDSSGGSTPQNPPPGFMVQGPNGQPMYAPIGYFPPYADGGRPPSSHSRPASASRKPQATPSYDPYSPYQSSRYLSRPEVYRPSSSSPRRSPDELYVPRHRAASSAQFSPEGYCHPSMPPRQGRRNVSGPADVNYTKLRRVAPSSPLAEQPSPMLEEIPDRRASAPAMDQRDGTPSSSSSGDDNQGVRIEIVPDSKGGGYRIDRTPDSHGVLERLPVSNGGSGSERRRRSKR